MDGPELLPVVKRTAAAACTVLGIALVCWVLSRTPVAVTLTLLSLLLAVALDRAVAFLSRHHVARPLAIALVMTAVVLAIAGVVWLLVPPAVDQVAQLADNAPSLADKLQHTRAVQFARAHLGASASQLDPATVGRRLVGPALAIVASVLGGVAGLVTVLFVVIFMLGAGPQLVFTALARTKPAHRDLVARTLRHMYDALGGYVAGLFAIVLVNATLAGAFLAILGVPYFVPLAILSGLSSLVPFVGAIVAGALLAAVAWASNGAVAGLATVAYYVLYQQFENHVLGPLVYRRTVHLNPLVILLTALFFAELAGIPGALVAVPAAAAAQIVLGEIFRARRERLHLAKVEPSPSLLEGDQGHAQHGESGEHEHHPH